MSNEKLMKVDWFFLLGIIFYNCLLKEELVFFKVSDWLGFCVYWIFVGLEFDFG